MKRPFIKIVFVLSTAFLTAFSSPAFEENARPSLADHLHLSRDPIDGGWLANLIGLPDKETVNLFTEQVKEIVRDEEDRRCRAINPRLRTLVFEHFLIHQSIANAQGVYFHRKNAHQWAHILAMILKESGGDSTNVTDMTGRSITTHKTQTDLEHWRKVFTKSKHRPKLNNQTNFGLTQTSADRLFVAFRLARNQLYDTEYLEGKEGAATPRKIALNTAIAIRRLIWFYQDFSQGRINQSSMRIYKNDINKPEYADRYKKGIKMALLYCGTRFMFPANSKKNDYPTLKKSMASIAYCKLGNAQRGYGKKVIDEKCFAEWVTLCPALNIDIAMLTPLSYFATRNARPVCEKTFIRLINKK